MAALQTAILATKKALPELPDNYITGWADISPLRPEEGRRHDITLLQHSGIESVLQTNMMISGIQYCLYGNAAYVLRPQI